MLLALVLLAQTPLAEAPEAAQSPNASVVDAPLVVDAPAGDAPAPVHAPAASTTTVTARRGKPAGGAVTAGLAGLALGVGAPAVTIGAGSGFLAWLYGQAAAGACIGVQPALVAVGVSAGICGAAFAFGPCGSILATAGAVWGAQADGRDPLPAFLGGLPGIGLAAVGVTLGVLAFTFGNLAVIVPAIGVLGLAVVFAAAAPPCSYLGASVADLGTLVVTELSRDERGEGVEPAREPVAMAY
jgi:hypothetical protein